MPSKEGIMQSLIRVNQSGNRVRSNLRKWPRWPNERGEPPNYASELNDKMWLLTDASERSGKTKMKNQKNGFCTVSNARKGVKNQ